MLSQNLFEFLCSVKLEASNFNSYIFGDVFKFTLALLQFHFQLADWKMGVRSNKLWPGIRCGGVGNYITSIINLSINNQ